MRTFGHPGKAIPDAAAAAGTGPQQKKRKRKKKYKKENFFEFLCVVPAVFLIVLLNHYPLVELVRYSFTDWNMLKKSYQYVGLKNWKWFFTTLDTNHVLNSFKVTFLYTVAHLAIIIVVGLLCALLFSRMTKGFAFMRSVIFMPHYIAMSSVAIIFIWLTNESYGVFNYVLKQLGLQPVAWLSSSSMALWTLVIVASWRGIGYNMLIYLSAMQGISKDYYEAASLDGASKLSVFRYITLPLLAPTTAFLLVTQFISSMKVYNIVDIMTSGGPAHSTEVLVYLLYQMTFEDYRIDRASVIAIVFFIFLMIITALTTKWQDRKINYDA
ncbi:MAG: sugar ABC transporter permease [Oscillospiraceae bacterium]|nr:sugar ABC transporter permease [Oscillospiraceae bacterium]